MTGSAERPTKGGVEKVIIAFMVNVYGKRLLTVLANGIGR